MALEAGTIFVTVLPNTSLFAADLERKLGPAVLAGPTRGLAGVEKEASKLSLTSRGMVGNLGAAEKGLGSLGKATSSPIAALSGLTTSVTGFSKLSTLGYAAAGAAVVAFGVSSVKAYDTHNVALKQLQNSISIMPALAGASTAAFDKQADAILHLTGRERDEVLAADDVLARFSLTQQQIQQVIPTVADMAQKLGTDMPDAALLFGKASEGMVRGLKALGINMSAAQFQALSFGDKVALLSSKVEGAAATFGATLPGQLAILKGDFRDLEIEVGEKLVPVLTTLVHVASDLLPIVVRLAPAALTLGGAFLGFKVLEGLVGLGTRAVASLTGIGAASVPAVTGLEAVGGAATIASGEMKLFVANAQGVVVAEREIGAGGGAAALGKIGPLAGASAIEVEALGGSILGVATGLGAVALASKTVGDIFGRSGASQDAEVIHKLADEFVRTEGAARLTVGTFRDLLTTSARAPKAFTDTANAAQDLTHAIIAASSHLKEGGAAEFGDILRNDLIPAFQSSQLSLGNFLGVVDGGVKVFGEGAEGQQNYRDALMALAPAILAGHVNQNQLNVLYAEGNKLLGPGKAQKIVNDYALAQWVASDAAAAHARSLKLVEAALVKVHEGLKGATGEVSTFALISGQSFDALKTQTGDLAKELSTALSGADPAVTLDTFRGDWTKFLDSTKAAVATWHDKVAAAWDMTGPLNALLGETHVTFGDLNKALDDQIAAQHRWLADQQQAYRFAGDAAKPFIAFLADKGPQAVGLLDAALSKGKPGFDAYVDKFNKGQAGSQVFADKVQGPLIGSIDHLTRAFEVMISTILKVPLSVITDLVANTGPAEGAINRTVADLRREGLFIVGSKFGHAGGVVLHDGGPTKGLKPNETVRILELGEFVVNRTAAAYAGPALEVLNAAIPRHHVGGEVLPRMTAGIPPPAILPPPLNVVASERSIREVERLTMHVGGPIPEISIATPGQPKGLQDLAGAYATYGKLRIPEITMSVGIPPGTLRPGPEWQRPPPSGEDGGNVHGGHERDGGPSISAANGLDMLFRRPTTIQVAEDNRPEYVRVTPGTVAPGAVTTEGIAEALRGVIREELLPALEALGRPNVHEENHFNQLDSPEDMVRKMRWLRATTPSGVRR
jgi:hypothetical protein